MKIWDDVAICLIACLPVSITKEEKKMALRRKPGAESDSLLEGSQSLPKTPIYPNAFSVFAAVGVGFIMITLVVLGTVVGTRTANIQNKVGTIVSIPVNDSCTTLGVEQRIDPGEFDRSGRGTADEKSQKHEKDREHFHSWTSLPKLDSSSV